MCWIRSKSYQLSGTIFFVQDVQAQWKDDFALNQMLRKKFRQEKKVMLEKEEKDQEIRDKGGLDLDLVSEDPADVKYARNIRFRAEGKAVGEFTIYDAFSKQTMFSKNTSRPKSLIFLILNHVAFLANVKQSILTAQD